LLPYFIKLLADQNSEVRLAYVVRAFLCAHHTSGLVPRDDAR
jgi:hypothetical protein